MLLLLRWNGEQRDGSEADYFPPFPFLVGFGVLDDFGPRAGFGDSKGCPMIFAGLETFLAGRDAGAWFVGGVVLSSRLDAPERLSGRNGRDGFDAAGSDGCARRLLPSVALFFQSSTTTFPLPLLFGEDFNGVPCRGVLVDLDNFGVLDGFADRGDFVDFSSPVAVPVFAEAACRYGDLPIRAGSGFP